MKHNDISKLYREELEKIGQNPAEWDRKIYFFAKKYNGVDGDVIKYINLAIKEEL